MKCLQGNLSTCNQDEKENRQVILNNEFFQEQTKLEISGNQPTPTEATISLVHKDYSKTQMFLKEAVNIIF